MATSNGDSDDPEVNPATLPGQSPDPTPNDVYADTRGDGDDELLRVMYVDDEVLLLKSELTDRTGRHIHRQEVRSAFDDQVEMDRLTPRPDADADIPEANVEQAGPSTTEQPADTEGDTPENNAQIDAYTDATGDEGDTPGNEDGGTGDTNTEAETNTDANTDTNTKSDTDDGTGDGGDADTADTEDWTAVDNIGVKTAEKLHEKGYETPGDIRQASDDELIEVPYLGEKGIEKLREAVA